MLHPTEHLNLYAKPAIAALQEQPLCLLRAANAVLQMQTVCDIAAWRSAHALWRDNFSISGCDWTPDEYVREGQRFTTEIHHREPATKCIATLSFAYQRGMIDDNIKVIDGRLIFEVSIDDFDVLSVLEEAVVAWGRELGRLRI